MNVSANLSQRKDAFRNADGDVCRAAWVRVVSRSTTMVPSTLNPGNSSETDRARLDRSNFENDKIRAFPGVIGVVESNAVNRATTYPRGKNYWLVGSGISLGGGDRVAASRRLRLESTAIR